MYPIFGEIALLDNDVRSASVITTRESIFLKITRSDFMRLVSTEPELALSIVLVLGQKIAQRLRQANEDIIKLTTAMALVLGKEKKEL
jgi:CRP-like cAMP-binding protein